jgi:malonate transporter and related proteins
VGETLLSTVPVFLMILLGGGLVYRRYVSADSWAQLQKLNYYLFLPAMFLSGLGSGDFSDAPLLRMVVAVVAVLGTAAAIVWVWRSRSAQTAKFGPQVLEASIRANVPYGMGVSLALGGPDGLTLFLVAAATYLPTVIVAGGLFGHFVGKQDLDPDTEQEYALASSLRLLAQNPIAWGTAGGVALNLANIPLVPGVAAMVQAAGYAAIPIGLLGAGAALSIAAAQNVFEAARGAATLSLAINLLGLPLAAGLAALVLGLEGSEAIAVVLIAALPCLVPRFSVLDASAQSVLPGVATIATLASAVTVPIAIWLLT